MVPRGTLPLCPASESTICPPPAVERDRVQDSTDIIGRGAGIAPPGRMGESVLASEALRFLQALARCSVFVFVFVLLCLHFTVIGERESVHEDEAWLSIFFENLPAGRSGCIF